jgi:hypothetical protein
MQRDEEVLREMMENKPKENLTETWAKNLRMAMKKLEAPMSPERKALELLTYGQEMKRAA